MKSGRRILPLGVLQERDRAPCLGQARPPRISIPSHVCLGGERGPDHLVPPLLVTHTGCPSHLFFFSPPPFSFLFSCQLSCAPPSSCSFPQFVRLLDGSFAQVASPEHARGCSDRPISEMNSSTLHGWRTLDKADFLKEVCSAVIMCVLFVALSMRHRHTQLSRLGEDIRFQDHPDVSPLQLSSSDLVLTNEVMSIPAYQVEREVRVEHGRNTFPEKPRRKDEGSSCFTNQAHIISLFLSQVSLCSLNGIITLPCSQRSTAVSCCPMTTPPWTLLRCTT